MLDLVTTVFSAPFILWALACAFEDWVEDNVGPRAVFSDPEFLEIKLEKMQ